MEKATVAVKAAALSNYPGMDVLMDQSRKVYLGKREHYDPHGYYDDSDGSLLYLSDNEALFSLLAQNPAWVLSQAEMIEAGSFRVEDFQELARLQETTLARFRPMQKITFAGRPFRPPPPGAKTKHRPHYREWRR